MIKFPNSALGLGLRMFVNAEPQKDIVLRLFKSVAEDPSSGADFVEVSGFGYDAISIPGTMWSFSADASGPTAKAEPQKFKFTGEAGIVRGFYMTRGFTDQLIGYEKFKSGPFSVENNGDTVTITPTIAWRA